jgi:hypothetical protein
MAAPVEAMPRAVRESTGLSLRDVQENPELLGIHAAELRKLTGGKVAVREISGQPRSVDGRGHVEGIRAKLAWLPVRNPLVDAPAVRSR